MTIINTQKELEKLCTKLRATPFVTVDTEFIREKTYWPNLCLIQVGNLDYAACIDPLAGLDLAPFFGLMSDESVVKVFHSGRQDAEILYHLSRSIPVPLFDTQVAAMVCGYGESVSYQHLVQDICKIGIDKGQRFTDWAMRPLNDAQVSYALADVTHLVHVYLNLKHRLEENSRTTWLAEEMEKLYSPSTYESQNSETWEKLLPNRSGRKVAAVLKALWMWREAKAKDLNRPRKFILSDDGMVALASAMPASQEAMDSIRVTTVKRSRDEVLNVIKDAIAQPPESYPSLERASGPQHPKRIRPLGELLRVLLHIRSEESGVASRLIATTADLDDITRDDNANVPALKGWRREIFGEDALRLKSGQIAITFNPKRRAIDLVENLDTAREANDAKAQAKLPLEA